MFVILLCTVTGFLAGLVFLMARRRIRPGKVLAATFLGLFTAALYKLFKDFSRHTNRWNGF